MATGDKYKTGYKITAVEQSDGSYASQAIVPPAGSVKMEGVYSVGTSSAVLVTANGKRRSLFIRNDGNTIVYLKSGSAASLNQGWRLAPGTSVTYGHGLAVHAIASAATEVSVLEESI